jgi:hypothetical protein
MNPTPQQMLTAIVQAGIEGGFTLNKRKHCYMTSIEWINRYTIGFRASDTNIEEHLKSYTTLKNTHIDLDRLTVADLINDGEFMRLIYGDKLWCIVAGKLFDKTCLLKTGVCKICSRTPNGQALLAYEHIQQQAIIIDNPQDQVRFLYESMGGRG